MRITKNTNSRFAKNANEINTDSSIKEPLFTSLVGYISLQKFINEGGCLRERQTIYCERNKRTPLESGILMYWETKQVKMDLTGYGSSGESVATIKSNNTGKVSQWPFSMLYVKD